MHSFIETKRSSIQTTKAQCHHAATNVTLEIEIPEYGTIDRIRLLEHLEDGVEEASFQPAGYSDCKGEKFTPPPNDKNMITYFDYSDHLQKITWAQLLVATRSIYILLKSLYPTNFRR